MPPALQVHLFGLGAILLHAIGETRGVPSALVALERQWSDAATARRLYSQARCSLRGGPEEAARVRREEIRVRVRSQTTCGCDGKQQPVLGREALRERIRAWNRDKEHRVKLKIGCPPGKHIELLERLVAAEYDHQKAQEGGRAHDVRSEFRSGLGADEMLPCSIPMRQQPDPSLC